LSTGLINALSGQLSQAFKPALTSQ